MHSREHDPAEPRTEEFVLPGAARHLAPRRWTSTPVLVAGLAIAAVIGLGLFLLNAVSGGEEQSPAADSATTTGEPVPSSHVDVPSTTVVPTTTPATTTTTTAVTTTQPAPTTRPQPPATRVPAPGGGGDFAQQVVNLTNAERAKARCAPLRVDAKAQAAAQSHADDMAARDYYEHTSPEGKSADDRLAAAGYRAQGWAENIHRGPRDAVKAMNDWMASPGHRANILNCEYTVLGVGVNLKANGPWWVQVFAE